MRPETIVIVGSGPAGLATASHLSQFGYVPNILEQGNVPGAAWNKRPPDLKLATTRRLSSLPFYPMEPEFGRWPMARDWSAYLRRYAKRMGLLVKCNHEVHSVSSFENQWLVRTNREDFLCKVVVIATGEDRVPLMPDIPGVETFQGILVHSSEFKQTKRGNLRVLVIGAGTSGCDVATLLAKQGHYVWLSVRRAPVILPRAIFGVSTSGLGSIANLVPTQILDGVGFAVQAMAFGELPFEKKGRHRLSERRTIRYAPTIDNGIAASIMGGLVHILPPTTRFVGEHVEFAGGLVVKPDLVIAATGYVPRLEQFIHHPNVLDGSGRPIHESKLKTCAPGLYFVALRPRVGPLLRECKLEAKKTAWHIDQYVTMHFKHKKNI